MRIKVIGRIRPLLQKEKEAGEEVVTHVSNASHDDQNLSRESPKSDICVFSRSFISLAPKTYRLDNALDGNYYLLVIYFIHVVTLILL